MFSSFWSKDPTKDFPFDVTETVQEGETRSLWTLHRGKRRTNGEAVSIFRFDLVPGKDQRLFEVAKFGAKKLKSLRHPNILTFIDSMETDRSVIIVTEYVDPVDVYLESINEYTLEQKKGAISWGLLQVAKGVEFLIKNNHNHNNIHSGSIFVTSSGNWKISGLEYVTGSTEERVGEKHLVSLECYRVPECTRAGASTSDSYGLGILVWEIFNGPLSDPSQVRSPGKIPKSLQSLFLDLTNPCADLRISPSDFIQRSRSGDHSFMKNSFIDAMLFLEEIQMKEHGEKGRFFLNLDHNLDNYPRDICRYTILPHLITALEYGNGGAGVLGPLFKIGQLLDEDEYQKKIVPCILKLFACKDRATRAKLLQQTEHFAKHLSKNVINDQIYPQLAQGFVDSNPTIREQTVKCMLHLASKLSYSNLNEDLLSHFSRLQGRDEEGGIRTNTTVCLGKIASHLHPSIRHQTLIPAFLRSMRDPFPPARTAAILALSATHNYYSLKDTATKLIPALAHLTLDPDRSVRDQTFKAIKGFLSKMEKVSEDPSLAASMEVDLNKAGSEASTALSATWASWAVSSLTSKFYGSKIPSTVAASSTGTIGTSSGGQTSCGTSSTTSQSSVDSNSTPSDSKLSKVNNAHEQKVNEDIWGSAGDGWDEEDPTTTTTTTTTAWDEDPVSLDARTDTPPRNDTKASASDSRRSSDTKTPPGRNDWTLDDPEPDDLIPLSEERRRKPVQVKTIEITRETVPRKAKKGPMKLGAKKI